MEVIKKRGRKKPQTAMLSVDECEKEGEHEFTAVGLIRHRDATYSQVTVQIKGKKVTSIDIDGPNMKQIAIDALKIACMKRVVDAVSF